MVDMGYKARGNKKKIDRIAATLLLQSYLDHQRHVSN
jgi:RNase H-fold protein (predicted Holliday junction resolvase)